MEAYENLVKQHSESGSRSLFNKGVVYLTINNYHRLVQESEDYWLIFIYNSNKAEGLNKEIISIYNEIQSNFKNIIKFGVIDMSKQEQLKVFLPYNFPFLPAIFMYMQRTSEMLQNILYINPKNLEKFIDQTFRHDVKEMTYDKIRKF